MASIFNGLNMKVDAVFMLIKVSHLDLSGSGAIRTDRWIAERRLYVNFRNWRCYGRRQLFRQQSESEL